MKTRPNRKCSPLAVVDVGSGGEGEQTRNKKKTN